MIKNKNLFVFIAYLVFLYFLYTVNKSSSQYEVASWLDWKFWVPALIFFVMGFFGIRAGRRFTGHTWGGTSFSGFIDEGAISGTDGVRGGVALSLAYISFQIVTGLINVTILKYSVYGISGVTTLLVGAVMFVLMLPLYLLFLYLLNRQKTIPWSICAGWALFLLIAARM